MTPGVVGWYAHHVGSGHVTRARLVSRLMRTPVVILSSAAAPADWPEDRWVRLPLDDAPGGSDHTAGGALHWAPLGHAGYEARMSLIAEWVGSARPSLLLSDVSVEVTLLARTLGVPAATMVMAGDRSDQPHQLAYAAASALFAAWPPGVDLVDGWQPSWTAKLESVGAFSRFDDRRATTLPGDRKVAVLWGHGGSAVTAQDVKAAQRATPDWTWTVCDATDPDDVWTLLQTADVVVAHAGQNVVAEVAAARRPAVIVPQPRPHDEQRHLAAGLARRGLAHGLTSWPDPGRWPSLLASARPTRPADWSRWSDGAGALRLARALDRLAVEGAA